MSNMINAATLIETVVETLKEQFIQGAECQRDLPEPHYGTCYSVSMSREMACSHCRSLNQFDFLIEALRASGKDLHDREQRAQYEVDDIKLAHYGGSRDGTPEMKALTKQLAKLRAKHIKEVAV